MQVYHLIKHNQSFNSMKCTSQIIREVYGEKNFSCSATKATAIVAGVFEPMIIDQIKNELERVSYITMSTDASNHKDLKMFPVLLRYFLPLEGVKTRLIEFNNLPGETAEMIFNMLKDAWTKWNIRGKISGFSADNAPVNFGNVERSGPLNVFARMQREFDKKIIGIGCLAHTLHNTTRNSCLDNIPYDFNHILSLIHNQFKTSTKQTEALKAFCEEMDVEFKRVKSCVNTRFLAMKSSINAVLRVIGPLREYFVSSPSRKVPLTVSRFFEDPLHKFYLVLVRDLCEMFEIAILKIEGDAITGNEAVKIVKDIQTKLNNQIDSTFITIEAEEALREVAQSDPTFDETDSMNRTVLPLYRKFIY